MSDEISYLMGRIATHRLLTRDTPDADARLMHWTLVKDYQRVLAEVRHGRLWSTRAWTNSLAA